MKKIFIASLAALGLLSFAAVTKTLHSFSAKTLDGSDFKFSGLKGKKVLIVNTASECGYTPQYKDLQTLWDKYKDKNFVIIGFPCNDFGGQEPGTSAEIKTFCTRNYGVTFQMMEKVAVKGDQQSGIYKWLCNKSENGVEDAEVKWNFNKFLVDEDGKYVKHLGSKVNPMDPEITGWIEGK